MVRIVTRGLPVFALIVTGLGCAAPLEVAEGSRTLGPHGEVARRPDGVSEVKAFTLPPLDDRSSARGVVALRAPFPEAAIAQVVEAYVNAFTREDEGALAALLTSDAAPLEGRGGRGALLEGWRTRMKNLDYGVARGREVARLDQLQRFDPSDLEGPLVVRGRPKPPHMREGDVLVVVPLAPVRAAFGEPLFGEELVLLLRVRDDGYAIAGAAEGDPPAR